MKKYFTSFIVFFIIFVTYGQNCKLNFIILIDNKIKDFYVDDGAFFIRKYAKENEEKLPFKYYVGDLQLDKQDIDKLFDLKTGDKLSIRFKIISPAPYFLESFFEYEIPLDWINTEYMMMKIFTKSKINRKIFFFGEKSYLVEFSIPSQSTLIPRKK